ncbi:GntR family transcriptional regulator [Rhodobacterales bacterium 52_120_T64]|nr:GntR family transcriptional regulator [Rhodobacterales bacterium 52_120_T64]
MPFKKIEPEKAASAIIHQVEQLILRGVLRPGERLPSERDLATRFEVSRPTVRDALAALEASELVVTRPGAGAFVAQVLGSAFAPALVKLFSTHEEALFDYLSFRRDLEGMAVARAAEYANETDLAVITSIFNRMEAAHEKRNPTEEATIDAEFHLAVVEAAHNVVMLHMMRSMFEMLQTGVFYNRQILFGKRSTRDILLEQHRAIYEAIVSQNPDAARAAVEAHLAFIEDVMIQQNRDHRNEDVARQRLAHEKGR